MPLTIIQSAWGGKRDAAGQRLAYLTVEAGVHPKAFLSFTEDDWDKFIDYMNILTAWFNGNFMHEAAVIPKSVTVALQLLNNVWPYKPVPEKILYRSIPVETSIADSWRVGQTKNLRIAKRPLSSWAYTKQAAIKFAINFGRWNAPSRRTKQVVFAADVGKYQLTSGDHIREATRQLVANSYVQKSIQSIRDASEKEGKPNSLKERLDRATRELRGSKSVNRWTAQREVVCLLPNTTMKAVVSWIDSEEAEED